jgi:hypothetical protein
VANSLTRRRPGPRQEPARLSGQHPDRAVGLTGLGGCLGLLQLEVAVPYWRFLTGVDPRLRAPRGHAIGVTGNDVCAELDTISRPALAVRLGVHGLVIVLGCVPVAAGVTQALPGAMPAARRVRSLLPAPARLTVLA